MHPILASLLSATLILASQAHAQPPAGTAPIPSLASAGLTPAFADQAYGNRSQAQKLDIYLPDGEHQSLPVVLFIHGGGFRFGDKTTVPAAYIKGFLNAGYAVASSNYRLSGEARFPAASQDIGRAIEYLRANARRYHINPDQLVLMGESAGANLAALAGTAADSKVMYGALDDEEADIRPQAVIALFPPVDFMQLDSLMQQQGCADAHHGDADSFESQYLGGPLASKRAEAEAASPVTHIDAYTPPYFIQNGSADCEIGNAQAGLLATALQSRRIAVSYQQIEGAGHGGPQFESTANVDSILEWLAKTLEQ